MPLTPGYGETPLPHDELTALTQSVVDILDTPITKAAVYDLEQAVQDQVSEELLTAAIEGSLLLDELLSDYFVRDLHTRLYGDIWVWAGQLRQREVNIGVAPVQIAVELRTPSTTPDFAINRLSNPQSNDPCAPRLSHRLTFSGSALNVRLPWN